MKPEQPVGAGGGRKGVSAGSWWGGASGDPSPRDGVFPERADRKRGRVSEAVHSRITTKGDPVRHNKVPRRGMNRFEARVPTSRKRTGTLRWRVEHLGDRVPMVSAGSLPSPRSASRAAAG